MITDIEELYVECSCGSEVLKLEYDKEMKLYDIAVFHLNGKRSWKNRWKQIWHIIKTGEPYADNLVLKPEDVNKIVSFVDEINEADE